MKYRIFAAFHEDINSGLVWFSTPRLTQRSVVQIINHSNGRKIYCEALIIDDNFLDLYNKRGTKRIPITNKSSALVMSEWYRKLLGDFETQTEQDLSIDIVTCSRLKHFWVYSWACIRHPQVVVRIATLLGVWSFALALIGIILGVCGLLK